MALAPDFADLTWLFPYETAIAGRYTETPPFIVSAPFQSPYAPSPGTPMRTFSTQISHDATQGVVKHSYPPPQHYPYSSHVPPRTTIASFDNSIHPVQRNESSEMRLSDVGIVRSSAVVPTVPQPIPSPSLILTPAPRWLKVPQRVYKYGDKQRDFNRSEPISFSVNDLPGINMGNAFRKQFTGLDGRDEPMFRNAAKAISCRFLFPGYPSRSAQISTLGWAKDRVPITRSKLAYEVAKQLNRYLVSMAGRAMDGSIDQQWKIREGFMHLENMYLVRLLSVSTGSFQPEIWILTS